MNIFIGIIVLPGIVILTIFGFELFKQFYEVKEWKKEQERQIRWREFCDWEIPQDNDQKKF